MREGVARDGFHLFPAFPYYAYTNYRTNDVKPLYAYLMTRRAATATAPANTLPFPFKIRALQEDWKILFFRGERFQADPSKSGESELAVTRLYAPNGLSDLTSPIPLQKPFSIHRVLAQPSRRQVSSVADMAHGTRRGHLGGSPAEKRAGFFTTLETPVNE